MLALALTALALAPTAADAKLDCPGPPITTNGEVFNVGPRNTVVGLPGKVAMRRGNRWDTVDVGGRLTASVATADLEGDSCFDLVAGAPGRGRGGAVVVLRGARRTIDGTARVIRPKGVRPGDRFGAAVALSGSGGFQPTDLWVGAPGRDVRGHRDAGAVYRYRLHGKRRPELLGMYTAGMRAIRGARPEAGDMLGERLTAVSSGVIVGVPREDIGSAEDAGAVEFLRAKGRRMLRGQHFDQSRGGRETPEAGDRFGAAVSGHGNGAWVGAPGEDVGGLVDAGVIQDLDRRGYSASAKPLRAGPVLAQGSTGVPGAAEAGDRFGSAIVEGFGVLCQEESFLKVGVPGQDVDGVPDAGAVVATDDGSPCETRELSRGHGLVGAPVAGERVGESLGITLDRPGLDEDEHDTMVVTGPGSGALLTLYGDFEEPDPGVLDPPPGFAGEFALTYP